MISIIIGIICGCLLSTALYVCKQIRVVSDELDLARLKAENMRDTINYEWPTGHWKHVESLPWEVKNGKQG